MQNYYSKYMSHVTNTLLPFNKCNKCSLFIHVTSPNVNRQILFYFNNVRVSIYNVKLYIV